MRLQPRTQWHTVGLAAGAWATAESARAVLRVVPSRPAPGSSEGRPEARGPLGGRRTQLTCTAPVPPGSLVRPWRGGAARARDEGAPVDPLLTRGF